MDLMVGEAGEARWGGLAMRCAVGRGGVRADKHEGDGATPSGGFALRRLLYRADREAKPRTALPRRALDPADGWCDDPADPAYNFMIRLPYPARTEALWRADGVYDLIVPLGYNDDPAVPGRGSAIFLHLATPDFAPTAGCVALGRDDLLRVLAEADTASRVIVSGTGR
jgi:L,D-peptidoglycan transpeptidase YkuD (ErfK/YbiS/YcfS/YnhG family)